MPERLFDATLAITNKVPLREPELKSLRSLRYIGVAAYVYGPSPASMGGPDEFVDIEEFLHILRTHALSAYDYLLAS